MTDREKAIVMAHTGICMLQGKKFKIFHQYVEELLGEPIWTHELAHRMDEIRERSREDFIKLCEEDDNDD